MVSAGGLVEKSSLPHYQKRFVHATEADVSSILFFLNDGGLTNTKK